MNIFHHEPCDPPITPVTFGDEESPAVTARMQALFTDDQAARKSTEIDWNLVG